MKGFPSFTNESAICLCRGHIFIIDEKTRRFRAVFVYDAKSCLFTTKKWLTPKGNWIHEKGITPDITVELNDNYLENPTRENDNQFQEAFSTLEEQLNGK